MNRAERRNLKRKFKGQNLLVNPGVESIDRSAAQYCWLHNLRIVDIDNPTESEKKNIESVRLIPFETFDKGGQRVIGRACHRCHNAIIVKTSLLDSKKQSILKKPEDNTHANIYVPDVRNKI